MGVVSRPSLIGWTPDGTDEPTTGPWLNVDTAAGTAHTNSITETAIASFTFASGQLRDGDIIEFDGLVRATSTNSTDTLTLLLYFGATTLTTAAVTPSGGAHDVADNDIWRVKGTITVRDADDSGTAVVMATTYADPVQTGAATTAVMEDVYLELGTIDFTAPLLLEIGADWSVASASNSCQTEIWNVRLKTR